MAAFFVVFCLGLTWGYSIMTGQITTGLLLAHFYLVILVIIYHFTEKKLWPKLKES